MTQIVSKDESLKTPTVESKKKLPFFSLFFFYVAFNNRGLTGYDTSRLLMNVNLQIVVQIFVGNAQSLKEHPVYNYPYTHRLLSLHF